MPKFPVSAKKSAALEQRMQALALQENQIEEAYFKGTGVALTHIPTGIRVRAYRERSQALNRFLARRLLVEELEARKEGKTRHEAKAEAIHEEKIRKGKVKAGARPARTFDVAKAMRQFQLRAPNPPKDSDDD